MKKVTVFILFVLCLTLYSDNYFERINRFSGDNASLWKNYISSLEGKKEDCATFILKNCSNADLATLTPAYLDTNITYALKAQELEYTKYPDEIFKYFVLPHRVSQEPLEEYRNKFYKEIYPRIKDAKTLSEAAVLVNLWVNENYYFKSTHGRDQAPLTTLRRGFGRCEENMILYIAAARSVGIPARPVSAPFWNFMDNNHAWIEVYTENGWQFMGDLYKESGEGWVTDRARRATMVVSEAMGYYDSPNVIKQKDRYTVLSSLDAYSKTLHTEILVTDNNNPVSDAKVVVYAASFGGIFPMQKLKTDDNGLVKLPIGRGSVYLIASKDDKACGKLFNTLEGDAPKIELELEKDFDFTFDVNFQFPLPNSIELEKDLKYVEVENINDIKEIASLKRKEGVFKNMKGNQFIPFYEKVYQLNDGETKKKFLDKADELCFASDDYLYCFKKFKDDSLKTKILVDFIDQWDIKELCEMPDTTALINAVKIYHDGKKRFEGQVSDSIFIESVIRKTWSSATPPSSGWEKELYAKVESLTGEDLEETANNVLAWVNDNVEVDDDFMWNYFTPSLTPVEIIRLKYVLPIYRTKAINSSLKILGVPTRWKGWLEYYNGTDWVRLEKEEKEEEKAETKSISISIFADGEQVKASPFENFLVAEYFEGDMSYAFFEGEHDSLVFNATYSAKPNSKYYVSGIIRNQNGDANIVMLPVEKADDGKIEVHIKTPKEYLDNTEKWNEKTISALYEIVGDDDTILLIRSKETTEPQIRITDLFASKKADFEKKGYKLVLYSEGDKVNSDTFEVKNGEQILNLDNSAYPAVFVFKKGKLTFSANGYNLGLADLVLKKSRIK